MATRLGSSLPQERLTPTNLMVFFSWASSGARLERKKGIVVTDTKETRTTDETRLSFLMFSSFGITTYEAGPQAMISRRQSIFSHLCFILAISSGVVLTVFGNSSIHSKGLQASMMAME